MSSGEETDHTWASSYSSKLAASNVRIYLPFIHAGSLRGTAPPSTVCQMMVTFTLF